MNRTELQLRVLRFLLDAYVRDKFHILHHTIVAEASGLQHELAIAIEEEENERATPKP